MTTYKMNATERQTYCMRKLFQLNEYKVVLDENNVFFEVLDTNNTLVGYGAKYSGLRWHVSGPAALKEQMLGV